MTTKPERLYRRYIAKPPVSLEKIHYEPFHGKVLYKTPKYNEYFWQNFKFFDALDFIAEVTAHIPPKGMQYILKVWPVFFSNPRAMEAYGILCEAGSSGLEGQIPR